MGPGDRARDIGALMGDFLDQYLEARVGDASRNEVLEALRGHVLRTVVVVLEAPDGSILMRTVGSIFENQTATTPSPGRPARNSLSTAMVPSPIAGTSTTISVSTTACPPKATTGRRP